MRRKNHRSAVALVLLGLSGAAMNTTLPARAVVFVQEMERSSNGTNQVSIWERVVYSLIEASNRGADCRTPSMF